MDNQWIVLYNLHLATKYHAHIRITMREAIVANGEWQNRDEIKAYLKDVVSAFEASWRLFSFRMHDGTPSVTRLAVHKPGMHTVVYNDNASIFETINSEQNQKTTLTEYFQTNIDYPLARNDALLSSLLDPLEGLSMLNYGKLELGGAPDFQH
jgi:hypothetical protein